MQITVEALVKAPVAKVWSAYTTPEDIVQWNAASPDWHTTRATVDLRVGGAFSSRMEAKDGSFGFDFAGTYTQVVPHALIAYAFGERTGLVAFVPGADGVTVRVTCGWAWALSAPRSMRQKARLNPRAHPGRISARRLP